MFFTLAISAATPDSCAALIRAACQADPRIMPVPGPAQVTWRAPGECGAVLHWGEAHRTAASRAGTIWAEGATVRAATSLTRVDPVYLAESAGAVVVSDRAGRAFADRGQGQQADRRGAAAGRSAVPRPHARVRRPPGCGHRGHDRRLATLAAMMSGDWLNGGG